MSDDDHRRLVALAAGLAKHDARIEKPYYEWHAFDELMESGLAPELPWDQWRQGDDKAGEPDFVFGAIGSPILAGVEITEFAESETRERNAALRRLQSGERPYRAGKKARNDVERDAIRSFEDAGGPGGRLQNIQNMYSQCGKTTFANEIVNRIDDKKSKGYYISASYPLYLIVFVRSYINVDSDENGAIELVRQHNMGKFVGVWFIHDRKISKLTA